MCFCCTFFFFLMSASIVLFFFFSSRRLHTRSYGDWSSDVCSSDLPCAVHESGNPDTAIDGAETEGGMPETVDKGGRIGCGVSTNVSTAPNPGVIENIDDGSIHRAIEDVSLIRNNRRRASGGRWGMADIQAEILC